MMHVLTHLAHIVMIYLQYPIEMVLVYVEEYVLIDWMSMYLEIMVCRVKSLQEYNLEKKNFFEKFFLKFNLFTKWPHVNAFGISKCNI